jgi:hypothetical protein
MIENYSSANLSFRSRKAFIDNMHKSRASIKARGDAEHAVSRVQDFLLLEGDQNHRFGLALAGLSNLLHPKLYLGMSDILEAEARALKQYKSIWVQYFLLFQLRFFNFNYAYRRDPNILPNGRLGLPRLISEIAPMVAIFGNRSLFENSLNQILEAFDKGMFANSITYVTQLFMLQLAESFMGYPPRDWKSYIDIDPRKEEPLFEELWNLWDTEDVNQLEPLLVQLLNRHTFKASRDNPDGGRDFEGYSEQFPIELLFIYRLREWKGLVNPNIKHQLTEPPFHELPEPLEVLEFDELTLNFVKEIRGLFPDMDQAIAEMKTRGWHMLL